MAIIISKQKTPLYGGGSNVGVNIGFGIGSIDKVLAKIGSTTDSNIYFGYDVSNGTGAIVAKGKLVSSKIIDVQLINEVKASEGVEAVAPSVSVKYVDPSNNVITKSLPLVSQAELDDLLALAKSYTDSSVASALKDAKDYTDSSVATALKDAKDYTDTSINTALTTINTHFNVLDSSVNTLESSVKTIDTSVKKLENLVYTDNDKTINKVSEIIDWFNSLPTDSSTAVELIADVNQNKEDITDISTRLDNVSTYAANTSSNLNDVSVRLNDTSVKLEGVSVRLGLSTDASTAETAFGYANKALDEIASLNVEDTSVQDQYVVSVSLENGKISVEKATITKLTVNEDSSTYAEIDASTLHIKTTTLNTAVGLTKDADGNYVAADGKITEPGLATAIDVAAEIVADEEAVAIALNELNLRANDTSNLLGELGDTSTDPTAFGRIEYVYETLNTNVIDQLEPINASIKDISTRLNDVSGNLYDLDTDVDDISARLNNVSTYAANTSSNLNDASTRLSILNTSVSDISTRLNNVSTYAANTSSNLNDVSVRLNNVSTYAYDTSVRVDVLDSSVSAIEKLIKADGGTIDKVNEVITWFTGLETDSSTATELVEQVITNTNDIEEVSARLANTSIVVTDDSSSYISANGHEVTIKTSKLADFVGISKDTDGSYIIADTSIELTGLAVASDVAKELVADLKVIALALNEHNDAITDVSTKLSKLLYEDTEVAGQYVSTVQEVDGVISVERKTLPVIKIAANSSVYAGADEHTITIKTTSLSDAVGMTKNEDGDYVAADGTITTTGLATAADVAAEIVSDEEVIAAALNEQKGYIDDLGDAIDDLYDTIGESTDTSTTNTLYGKATWIYEDLSAKIDNIDVTDQLVPINTSISNISTRLNNVSTYAANTSSNLNDVSVRLNNVSTYAANTSSNLNDVSVRLNNVSTYAYNTSVRVDTLDSSVSAIENLINEDGGTINKVNEVINWFKDLSTNSSTAVELIANVNTNTKDITNVSTRLNDTSVKLDDVSVRLGLSTDASTAETAFGYANKALAEIADLDVIDSSVENQYVVSVSQEDGKISVERATLIVPNISVNENSSTFIAANGHELSILTTAIGDYSGLSQDADGKLIVSNSSTELKGLATAQDVANEIVADEKVIAVAYNNHEQRIVAVENSSVYTTVDKIDASYVIEAEDASETQAAIAEVSIENGKSVYSITVKLNGEGKEATLTIEVINSAVITKLVELLAAETKRADAAEAALDASVKNHEARLQWIELNASTGE